MTKLSSSSNAVDLAVNYWKQLTVWAAAHTSGLQLPLKKPLFRLRLPKGHWGANPGIAWIISHVSVQWTEEEPILGVLGTGHATSFQFAHHLAIQKTIDWTAANSLIAKYGVPGGDATEYIKFPQNLPHLFGELGSAVAVSQALARSQDRFVLCVIGDGECETPATIAALVHHNEIKRLGQQRLLIVVNCNGYRMGDKASMGYTKLQSLLLNLGYEVFISYTGAKNATHTAAKALKLAKEGKSVVWLSVTEKGWPAPQDLIQTKFAGHITHKITSVLHNEGSIDAFDTFISKLQQHVDNKIFSNEERYELATKLLFSIPENKKLPKQHSPTNHVPSNSPLSSMSAIDQALNKMDIIVFSPDEAESNKLKFIIKNKKAIEVLAEEVLLGWTIGTIAAGKPSVFVTYEAFAPLIGSQFTQYIKLANAQNLSQRLPLVLICTSLAWANCPTHQNTDIWDIALNRPSSTCNISCPIGATSAAQRLTLALNKRDGSATILFTSKHSIPNLYDPGGSVFIYRNTTISSTKHLILVCGDICFVEAIASAQLAAKKGIRVDILAITEPNKLKSCSLKAVVSKYSTLLGSVMCSPRTLSGVLFTACDSIFEVLGIHETHAATPYDFLKMNGIDRYSLLKKITKINEIEVSEKYGSYLIPDFTPHKDWQILSVDVE